MRTADLLAVAGSELPAEYLPADPAASRQIERVCGANFGFAASTAMRQYADSLPRIPAATGGVGLPALTNVTFGAAFKRLIVVRNLTRRALAHATISAQSTINVLMTDHRLPSAPRLLLIAAALCLSGTLSKRWRLVRAATRPPIRPRRSSHWLRCRDCGHSASWSGLSHRYRLTRSTPSSHSGSRPRREARPTSDIRPDGHHLPSAYQACPVT